MKRSEMIKILSNRISSILGDFFYEEEADKVLTFLENQGMLPPPVKSGGEDPHPPYFTNEWEPE